MGDAGHAGGAARSERGPWRAVATFLAVAMVLAGCGPQTPATRPAVDGMWSPYLATVVRGRSSGGLDGPRCDSEFSGAVEDVLWARRHGQ